jgi:hypothetical protein
MTPAPEHGYFTPSTTTMLFKVAGAIAVPEATPAVAGEEPNEALAVAPE